MSKEKELYIVNPNHYKLICDLKGQLQQKENIIKEVREFVEKWKYEDGDGSVFFDINTNPDDLLRILDKGE